jgi:predicted acetyltransferase
MILRFPQLSDEVSLRLGHQELALDGANFLLDAYREDEDFAGYISRVENSFRGVDLLEGRVPATFLIAEIDDEIVGRVSIRHELNDWLAAYGGHIGYAVRPQFRRRGYAQEILRLALIIAASHHITKALLTCLDDNHGSIRVIEKNGGVFEGTIEEEGKLLRRYWVPTSA